MKDIDGAAQYKYEQRRVRIQDHDKLRDIEFLVMKNRHSFDC